jgi:hypothetical protein
MQTLIAILLFSVTLSAPFGEADARAVEVDAEGMVLEVEVEIDGSALVVLARGAGPVDELPPVALTELSPGRWGGIVEIPIIEDILLGFEIIRPDGGSALVSALNPLSALGVDPAIFAVGDTTTAAPEATDRSDQGGDDPSFAPIWLAIAAGAAALALLLIWWLGGGDDESDADAVPAHGTRAHHVGASATPPDESQDAAGTEPADDR